MAFLKNSYSKIWRITYPIILGSLAQNFVYIADTAFLGRVSEVALGAAAIGGLFYVAIFMLGMGLGTGTQIIIARRKGEKQIQGIGAIVDHSFYLLIGFSFLLFVIIKLLSPSLLLPAISSGGIYVASMEYLDYRVYGIFFAFINVVFRAFYVGIGDTKVLIWSTASMALVNIVLDYCLIFGHWGFPTMGIGGAALASVISEVFTTGYFVLHITRKKRNTGQSFVDDYQLFQFLRPAWKTFQTIFKVGLPVMFQTFISVSSWFVFYLIIEQEGERPLAISNIIRSIYLVLMIPAFGFYSATHTLVSNAMGAKLVDEVWPTLKKIILLATVFTLVLMQVNIFFPLEVIGVYTDNAELALAVAPTLEVITIALLILPATFILFGAVAGTGNTTVSLIIEVVTILIYLAFTYEIAIYRHWPVHQIWYAEFVYLACLGGFSWIYLKLGRWEKTEF